MEGHATEKMSLCASKGHMTFALLKKRTLIYLLMRRIRMNWVLQNLALAVRTSVSARAPHIYSLLQLFNPPSASVVYLDGTCGYQNEKIKREHVNMFLKKKQINSKVMIICMQHD